MDIGVGLDSQNLGPREEAELAGAAAGMGYASLWTPATGDYDFFQLCLHRWNGARSAGHPGMAVGVGAYPVEALSPASFAVCAATASDLTGGRFILGIGSGGVHRDDYGGRFGRAVPEIALMRDHLAIITGLLRGEKVDYDGKVVSHHGPPLRLHGLPPRPTPVYLAALGPQMLRLGGELADGILLNVSTPEQIAWAREQVALGAAKTGRDPHACKVVSLVRMTVDDDVQVARHALVRSVMGYALGRSIPSERERGLGYRGHFERMGFTDDLLRLDDMRRRGATQDELIAAFPDELALKVGYFGAAAGAAAALGALTAGLDTAIVRVVPARPTPESALAVMEACRPDGGTSGSGTRRRETGKE
ncbi:MAG: LLM class flavin-dependent oxidoreductase [Chloroflexi bacterium]|nr:LLM class flavin-dependent oxidoreductase [Chloroflexota bacterium]